MITLKATISTENNRVEIKYEVIYSEDSKKNPETPWHEFNSRLEALLSKKCESIYGQQINIKAEIKPNEANTNSTYYIYELPQDPLKALVLLNHLVCMLCTNDVNEFYFDNELVPKVESNHPDKSRRKRVSEYETGFLLLEKWLNKIINLKSAPHYVNVITAFKKHKQYYEQFEQDSFKLDNHHSYAISCVKYMEDQAVLDDILTPEHKPFDSQQLAQLAELKKTTTTEQFAQIINVLRLQGLTNFYRTFCVGKKAHDGGSFTERYTEFSFLEGVRFSLVDNLLTIEKFSETPAYQDYYAPGKKNHAVFVDEIKWFAATAGLNLIQCDHIAIVFDEESSRKLRQWRVHADVDYVESLLKEQKKVSLLEEYKEVSSPAQQRLTNFFSSASSTNSSTEEQKLEFNP